MTEHKLVLQEFAVTPVGAAVISAGARRMGVTADSIARTIADLPSMDFYMPNREQRRSWRGDESVLVGSSLGADRSVFDAHGPNAARVRVAGGRPVSAHAVFLLQPAETKSRRIGAQAMVPGTAIEDANDGEISGSIIQYLPNGQKRIIELADYLAGRPRMISRQRLGVFQPRISFDETCNPETAIEPCNDEGTGGGGGFVNDTSFLERIVVLGVCDNNDCGQNNEFEWHNYISHNNGSTFTGRVDIQLQLPSFFEANVHIPALFAKPYPNSSDLIQSDVVETDAISPDDHFGSPRWYPNTFGHSSDNNVLMSEGETRCGYESPPPTERFDCPPYTPYFWSEVNQSFLWRLP